MNEMLNIVGISTIVSAIVAFIFDTIKHKMNLKFEKLFMEKMERYRSILVFMSVIINSDNYEHIQTSIRPQNNNKQNIINYYMDELKLHKSFCILFADDSVIDALSDFINNSTLENFDKTANAMRYDLWHSKYSK